METNVSEIWVYLSSSPLFGLTLTLVAYCIAHGIYTHSGGHPLCNPVLLSIIMIITVLVLTNIEYPHYFAGAQYIHFLLGPVTVALGYPLYRQLTKLKQLWLPISAALISGIIVGTISSILLVRWLGGSIEVQLSIAPKSVTAPVAMGIAEKIGGLASLTAALVITTGIIGALICTIIFKVMRTKDDSIKGIALGLSAHGIGTARAFYLSKEMGAFSGLAMALSALLTALILPCLISYLF
ncbi:MAG: LrgB family protein [Pseudomonadota bacterium]